MKTALLFFLMIPSSLIVAQGSVLEGTLDWSKWETILPELQKKQALKALIEGAKTLPASIAKQYAEGKNHSTFHILDLDSDSQLDIVYNGPIGSGNGIVLFLKSGSSYIQSNILGGNIVEIERSKLSGHVQFKIQQDPSGEEHYRLIVNLSIRPNDFKMLTSAEYSYKTNTQIPDTFFPPKPFITKVEYNLRAQPRIDASPNGWLEKIEGNVVAIYPAGSIGKAIAQTTDEKGRVWWFVIMENNLWPNRSLLVYKKPTNMSLGWMSKRFLVEIKQ
ncbi:MAG: hypothetical protein ABJG78_02825 [Cyclobacteriaceae bacterium]